MVVSFLAYRLHPQNASRLESLRDAETVL